MLLMSTLPIGWGYTYDRRAGKYPYPHDCRADKDSYPHDKNVTGDLWTLNFVLHLLWLIFPLCSSVPC